MNDTAVTDWKISFRPITKSDLPNLIRWQSEGEVAMWYWDLQEEPKDVLIQRWAEKVTSTDDVTDRYVINVNGQDIGEIQDYVVDSDPAYAAEVGISNCAGIDVLIGEPEWRNRGVGTGVLSAYVKGIVFLRPGIKTCIIDPEPRNHRAIRCYEKVGFSHVRTYHSDEDNIDVYLMRLDNPE